jgi:hypothetical protein
MKSFLLGLLLAALLPLGAGCVVYGGGYYGYYGYGYYGYPYSYYRPYGYYYPYRYYPY